jgi:hypothetical protein
MLVLNAASFSAMAGQLQFIVDEISEYEVH